MSRFAFLALAALAFLAACGGGRDEGAIRRTVEDFVRALDDDPPRAYTLLAQECKDQIGFVEFAAGRSLFEGALGESELQVKDVEVLEEQDDETLADFQIVLISEGEEIPLSLGSDGPLWFVKEQGRWRFADCAFFGGGEEEEEGAAVAEPAPPEDDALSLARRAEADDDPGLPGEYVDLPAISGGPYPETAQHFSGELSYKQQGLPPAGGPHWGNAPCGDDPDDSPPLCGPVPRGIYRKPWPAESLVHTMEHAGVIIWYNTTDQSIIDQLDDFARDNDDKNLVLVPHPDIEAEHIAITVWSRRDKFPVSEYSRERLQRFIDVLYCRFDPEEFCGRIISEPVGEPFPLNDR